MKEENEVKNPITRVFYGERNAWSKERKLKYATDCLETAKEKGWTHTAEGWAETIEWLNREEPDE